MILSYQAGQGGNLDTLKSKIRPLLPILYGGSKNVIDRQTDRHTHWHTDKMKIRDTMEIFQDPSSGSLSNTKYNLPYNN